MIQILFEPAKDGYSPLMVDLSFHDGGCNVGVLRADPNSKFGSRINDGYHVTYGLNDRPPTIVNGDGLPVNGLEASRIIDAVHQAEKSFLLDPAEAASKAAEEIARARADAEAAEKSMQSPHAIISGVHKRLGGLTTPNGTIEAWMSRDKGNPALFIKTDPRQAGSPILEFDSEGKLLGYTTYGNPTPADKLSETQMSNYYSLAQQAWDNPAFAAIAKAYMGDAAFADMSRGIGDNCKVHILQEGDNLYNTRAHGLTPPSP